MTTQDDFQVSVKNSTAEFLRDVAKLRQLEAMDRAMLAAAFERQARKLMEEEVRPRIERVLQELVRAKMAAPPPPAPPVASSSGGDDGLPRRVERLEGKVDKMAEDVGDIKVRLGRMEERLDQTATKVDIAKLDGRLDQAVERMGHMPKRAEMYLAAGVALSMMLGVMAKGFGWI